MKEIKTINIGMGYAKGKRFETALRYLRQGYDRVVTESGSDITVYCAKGCGYNSMMTFVAEVDIKAGELTSIKKLY